MGGGGEGGGVSWSREIPLDKCNGNPFEQDPLLEIYDRPFAQILYLQHYLEAVRDWSLITGRGGGATKREFYLYENGGGGRKCFSHAEVVGGTQCFGVVLSGSMKF